jgi:hypothetical protein
MRTRLTLVIEVDHNPDYDPVDHFVWYFDDEAPEPLTTVITESWTDIVDIREALNPWTEYTGLAPRPCSYCGRPAKVVVLQPVKGHPKGDLIFRCEMHRLPEWTEDARKAMEAMA